MCSAAFADYTFYVENSTMVDAYFNVFNAIGALFSSDDYVDLLRFAFLVGGFFVFAGGVLKAWEGNANTTTLFPYAKYLAVGVALLTIVFASKTTMWVTTKNLPSFCSTSSPTTGFAVELPSILAYAFNATNQIGTGLTQLAEAAYSLPADTSKGTTLMSDNGEFMGALNKSIKVLSIDPDEIGLNQLTGEKFSFSEHWGNFISTCIYQVANNKGVEGDKFISDFKTAKNTFAYTKTILDYSFSTETKKVGDYLIETSGTFTTCRNYYSFLEDATKKVVADSSCLLDLNGGALQLLGGGTGTGNLQSKMDDIIIQAGINSAHFTAKGINSIGINSDYTAGKTLAQNNMEAFGAASYMAEMMPYLQMTMRAILYAFFPFIFVVILLPGGIQVLKQYMQTIIWVELWSPTAAVINMFVSLKFEDEIGGKISEQGLTIVTANSLLSEASTIAGVGAVLYLSVPALTWLILKGSGQMLGSVAGRISANFAQNMGSNAVAKDLGQKEAANKNGTTVAHQQALEAKRNSVANYAENIAFEKSGGADDWREVANKKSLGKYRHDAKEVNSQDYVKNQEVQGEKKAAMNTGEVEAYLQNGGFDTTKNSSYIKTATDMQTTNKNVADAGSKEAVVKTKSDLENKNFNKDVELNNNTTKDDFKAKGVLEATDMNANTKVLEEKGKEAFRDAKEQELLTNVTSAAEKKAVSGSNEAVAKTATDKNVSGFKTDKKTFDSYTTDTVSTSDFEKRKEDITKTLETKAGIESLGQDTKDFYKSEAKMSVEDRKANMSKADTNNDNKVDSKEAAEYGKDMTTKSISDQNALKEKNVRLLENAEKFAKSENKDVRDTYNKAYAKYASQGHEKAAIAAASAVQASVATKEQQMNVDEKSEYVDRMQENGVDGVDKARVQTQKDVEDVNKTESEIESYANWIKEQNSGTKNMEKTEEKFFEKFKEKGMNESDARLAAKNATLMAYAKNGFNNSDYTKDTLEHNVAEARNAMNTELESQALKEGVLTEDDFNLVQREKALVKQAEAIEAKRENGALSPSLAMQKQIVNKKLRNTREELKDVQSNMKNWVENDSDAKRIVANADERINTTIENMKTAGLAKETENGLAFSDSFVSVDVNNMTEKQKGDFRTIKANLEGNSFKSVDGNGHNVEISYDIANNKVTDFETSKKGYAMVADFRYDKAYAFTDMTDGKYKKETAIASSVVDTVKTGISYSGLALGAAGKLPIGK
jgi:hypothetical protein